MYLEVIVRSSRNGAVVESFTMPLPGILRSKERPATDAVIVDGQAYFGLEVAAVVFERYQGPDWPEDRDTSYIGVQH